MGTDLIQLQDLLPLAIFGSITAGVWALLSLFGSGKGQADQRLDRVVGRASKQMQAQQNASLVRREARLERIVAKAASPLKSSDEEEVGKLKARLLHAGFRAENASQVYLGIKAIGLLIGLAIAVPITVGRWGLTINGIAYALLGGGVGFYLPAVVLGNLVKKRQGGIFLGLPDALDLMVVCVEAGLGLDAALRKVTAELAASCPEICEEFGILNAQMQMGRTRKDAFRDLGTRTGVDDVKALAAVVIQAEKFGASIGGALRVQSDAMRVKRRQLAEEKAAKTAVKIMIPLILFIFPGIFVVLVGPAGIQIAETMMK